MTDETKTCDCGRPLDHPEDRLCLYCIWVLGRDRAWWFVPSRRVSPPAPAPEDCEADA